VIGARGVAADAQPTNHFIVSIKCNAAAKGDDAARHEADAGALRLKPRIEGVGVVQSIKGTARLRHAIKIGGRQSKLIVAEVIRRARLCNRDRTASWPWVVSGVVADRVDHRAENAFAVDYGGPHFVRLEETAISTLDNRLQLVLHLSDDVGRNAAWLR